MFWDNFYYACLQKGTKPNPLAKELQIASGSMTSWKNGKLPNGETLLKIANYLDVSVDYLLGRTDEPQTINGNSIKTGDINGDNNANISTKEKNCTATDETVLELITVFKKLNFSDKAQVMSLVAELSNKEVK